jgi:hypothetical protein
MDRNEKIKQYVVNGGKLFTITLIDTIRDGGTKLIKTTNDTYYINKDSKKFHSDYPTSDKNLIIDFLHETYLIEQIETYIKRQEEDVVRNKNLFNELQNKRRD